jgi:1-deoxy-D-xylulose-5-phosphate reductoisomerase
MKRISILGSTGSIGRKTLQVISALRDEFEVAGLAAKTSIDLIEQQIYQFHPRQVSLTDEKCAEILRKRLKSKADVKDVEVLSGQEGMIKIATMEEADLFLSATFGSAGLLPTLESIKAGKDLAFVSKEILVMSGQLVMKAVAENHVNILPIDGEMSAIHQCLEGNRRHEYIKKLILTASGGPFRQTPIEVLSSVTPAQALRHPNWDMGAKITIDSATLMNKGFEVIEAKWLFDVKLSQIDVIIHPESIVHSMVEFIDGSLIAQLGIADMRIPIQYALTYPERMPTSTPPLNLISIGALTFEDVDMEKFPCLRLALTAAQIGGTMPTVLSGADEIVVQAFLEGKIGFLDIPKIIEKVMSIHDVKSSPGLDDILIVDNWAKQVTKEIIRYSPSKTLFIT